jgi:hypothetical protein
MKTNHLGIKWWHNEFFTKVHLLASKLVPVMVIHSIGGSCANWHHTLNPQWGATQPTQDEDHTSHEQSTRVHFDSPPGKGEEPLTITTIGVGDNHQPPLNDPRCSKPSRWWQPPRVTSEICSETWTPSASRCNHSSNALRLTLNLTKMMNQWWRWVRGLWLSSQGCYVNAKWPREWAWASHAWGLNRSPHEIEQLGSQSSLTRGDQTRRSAWPDS